MDNTSEFAEAGVFNVRAFGAKGDGTTVDTAAIQRAIDAAGAVQGTVFFPAGIYLSSMLRVPSHVGLLAHPTWAYKAMGGTVLRLCDAEAPCLISIAGAVGARINGLALDGARLGKGVTGIGNEGVTSSGPETAFSLERTYVTNFTGAGFDAPGTWAFWIRHCHFFLNDGDAITLRGCDIFIQHNTMIGNGGFGVRFQPGCTACSVLANRIEWNRLGNILLDNSSSFNINDNQLDRGGGPAIIICGRADHPVGSFTIEGNFINRNAAHLRAGEEHCHILLEHAHALTITGNTFTTGRNDDGSGPLTPTYGIVLDSVRHAVIANNAFVHGSLKESIIERGVNREIVIANNVGMQQPLPLPEEAHAPVPPAVTAVERRRNPETVAQRVSAPPEIDGDLSDPAWQAVTGIGPFLRFMDAQPAVEQTEVKVGYDADYLYLGITCWESQMAYLWAEYGPEERNAPISHDDTVDLFLVPRDGAVWHLLFNALGAGWMAHAPTPDGKELDYTLVTRRDSNRWTAEIRLPLRAMGEAPSAGDTWKFDVCRSEIPSGEQSSWAPRTRLRFMDPEAFGELRFG